MTDNRWQLVESIFQKAIKLPLDKRTAFLDAACGGDEQLRREVESLLAHDQSDHHALAAVISDAIHGLPDDMPLPTRDLTGQQCGRYHITGVLGRGGVGVVYQAYDTCLERYVAVKVLRETPSDPVAPPALRARGSRGSHAQPPKYLYHL